MEKWISSVHLDAELNKLRRAGKFKGEKQKQKTNAQR